MKKNYLKRVRNLTNVFHARFTECSERVWEACMNIQNQKELMKSQ